METFPALHSVESPQYGRPPMEYMVLRVQVKFAHSLLRCGWLWMGLFTLGLRMFASSLVDFLSRFAVEPQYRHQIFLVLSKVSFEGHIQNLQKISCWLKILMGFVGPILIKLWTSSIWGFLVACVTAFWELLIQKCWWPLGDHWSEQLTSPHLSGFVWYGGLKA